MQGGSLFSGKISFAPPTNAPSLFGTTPSLKTDQPKDEAKPQSSIFGSGLFGAPLFSQSNLQPGGIGEKIQFQNPFLNYNVKAANKGDEDGSEGEDAPEVEKRPPSPDSFKPTSSSAKANVPAMSLGPSPYSKLVTVIILMIILLD